MLTGYYFSRITKYNKSNNTILQVFDGWMKFCFEVLTGWMKISFSSARDEVRGPAEGPGSYVQSSEMNSFPFATFDSIFES